MKKYRVAVARLTVRKAPSAASGSIDTLPKDAEFYSHEQTTTPAGQLWAARNTGGWLCVNDRLQRFCEEVPMPTEPPLPEMPEPRGGLDLMSRVAALEEWARNLGFKA
jgi:hypothetical protein